MKILHILRSEPDEMVREFIQITSYDTEIVEFPMYKGELDYDRLLTEIFDCDRVISWW